MATFIILLPNNERVVIGLPNGDQVVPLTVRACECGCALLFQPAEPHQIYLNPDHQQAANNAKNRKTERRRKSA